MIDLHFAQDGVERKAKRRHPTIMGEFGRVTSPMLNNLIWDSSSSSSYMSCAVASATLTFEFIACLLFLFLFSVGGGAVQHNLRRIWAALLDSLSAFNPTIKREPNSIVTNTRFIQVGIIQLAARIKVFLLNVTVAFSCIRFCFCFQSKC